MLIAQQEKDHSVMGGQKNKMLNSLDHNEVDLLCFEFLTSPGGRGVSVCPTRSLVFLTLLEYAPLENDCFVGKSVANSVSFLSLFISTPPKDII